MAELKWQNTFVVGVYTCELSYSKRKGMWARWSPDLPPAKSLSEREIEQYRAGRDALLSEIAQSIGGNVAVIDV
jgi:hypothetical protein